LLKKLLDFFIFTSLFIACCAVLMVYQTALLFDLSFPFELYAFVFCGSVCSYNFHWYLTPPEMDRSSVKLRWNLSNRSIHLLLFILGLTGAAITSLLLLEHWLWLGVTALLTFLYSAPKIDHPLTIWLRRIAVGKTIFLAFAWMHVTTLLPLLVVNELSIQHILFAINRLFFIYAICIVFDRRDVEQDREAGIKSLVTYLSLKGVDRLFWASLFLVLLTSIVLYQWFSVIELTMMMVPSLLMGLLYERSKQSGSDYFYYFLLDGLMALSSPLLILAKFAR
ncbi:MAG TPA: UbiA family prenyltransferase, partial [Flavisolibacter sp.]